MDIGERVVVGSGGYLGMTGTVKAIDGDEVTLELVLFGRPIDVRLPRGEVEGAEDPRPRFLNDLDQFLSLLCGAELQRWWLDRLDLPQDDPVGEYRAYEDYALDLMARLGEEARTTAVAFRAAFPDGESVRDAVERWAEWGPARKDQLMAPFRGGRQAWTRHDPSPAVERREQALAALQATGAPVRYAGPSRDLGAMLGRPRSWVP
jgi:hypothetical protein